MNTAALKHPPRSELARILSLPKRPPLDTERERGTRRWNPRAQALVEVVTDMYTRGPRVSCSCQHRHVTATANGGLTIFLETDGPPSLPIYTDVSEFVRDNYDDADACERVGNLRNGFSIRLEGVGRRCITQLKPAQAWTLWELPRAQGILGMLSIGSGKTMAGLLAPLALSDCKLAVLFIKADQRHHYRLNYLLTRQHFQVPSIVFEDSKNSMQGSYIVTGAPVVHVMPYTTLSNKKNSAMLESLQPDLIVADECHSISNPDSTRTKRFLSYFKRHNGVRLAAWSGSLVNKSLKDGATLALHALGTQSPYPTNADDIVAWANVIDPSYMPDTTSATARGLYYDLAKTNIQDLKNAFYGAAAAKEVREAFRERSINTLGVISTKSSGVATSITIHERKAPPIPSTVNVALMGIRGDWIRPDGEEYFEALEQARCAREIGAGYYYRWTYPHMEPVEVIDDWFAKRKKFASALRGKLQNAETHLDSRALCEEAAARAFKVPRYRGELPVWPEETWPPWAEIADRVRPVQKAVWLDDFLARDAAAWAKDHTGIIWCLSRAFAIRVAELAGIPYHGGGPNAEANILAEDGTRSIVASIKSHSEGRDGLQYKFNKQLIAEMPASAKTFEQLFGRLAREGQKADVIETWLYRHTSENRDSLRKAIALAEFIEETTPNAQILLSADLTFDT